MTRVSSRLKITDVVLDFDGTCTQIPKIWRDYLAIYRQGLDDAKFGITDDDWEQAQTTVRRHSPKAGWTLGGCSAAPAAADPYILADESARLILRQRDDHKTVASTVNFQAYAAAPAPWRDEALEVFSRLIQRGIRLHFVSNSSTVIIEQRLKELLGDESRNIQVQSDAGKFRVCELNWDARSALPANARDKFDALPVAWGDSDNSKSIGRPVYLRRGAYFEAIHRVLGGDLSRLRSTVFCGDIWEMDLAMPCALGACIHLVERASPFDTYDYERRAVQESSSQGLISFDLWGLLNWL